MLLIIVTIWLLYGYYMVIIWLMMVNNNPGIYQYHLVGEIVNVNG